MTESVWSDRTLAAASALTARRPSIEMRELDVITEVAVMFADRFDPADRDYPVTDDSPRWHREVREALADLRAQGLVDADGAPTPAGVARAAAAQEPARRATPAGAAAAEPAEEPLLVPGVIAAPLRSRRARRKIGFADDEDRPIPVMAEINLRFGGGRAAAFDRLDDLWGRVAGGRTPRRVAGQYAAGDLSMRQVERLVAADAVPVAWRGRSVFRIWPDFPVRLHVDASCVTVKADAARRAFNAYGDDVVWAVVDTGIAKDHPHFSAYRTLDHPDVDDLHRDFTGDGEPTRDGAFVDEAGHGTHVAGIIAGAIGPWLAERQQQRAVRATENRHNPANPQQPMSVPRPVDEPDQLAGIAPRAKLVSLKAVNGGGTVADRVNRVIAALAYVREVNGEGTDGMRIHGVNLSVGYEFDPEWFACGRSPLCAEVDKLVRSGVVVVVAAGNSGYGTLAVRGMGAPSKFGLGMTINDPGNAERAITVGSTHRDAPHAYGVSFFSSKGPTGDGRCKPDLVAPGERITSCAAGQRLAAVLAGQPAPDTAVYVEDSGTSMAAPHVSGAIAALMSVRREFIGCPEQVKRIVVDSATSLGRSADFEGKGLLDLMRALQSV
jgi:subtilisin family serine protease